MQFVPIEKRKILVNSKNITLPPYICQLKISFGGIHIKGIVNTPSKWFVLVAQNLQDFRAILLSYNIDIENISVSDDNQSKPLRNRIPDDVQKFVWQRDQGRCVKC